MKECSIISEDGLKIDISHITSMILSIWVEEAASEFEKEMVGQNVQVKPVLHSLHILAALADAVTTLLVWLPTDIV